MAATPPRAQPAGTAARVAVLRWPDQDGERRRLAILGHPRVLLTSGDVTPGSIPDAKEVWVREGSSASALLEAMEQLGSTTAGTPDSPHLDDGNLLRVADRWVAIPPALRPLTQLFLDNYLEPVARATMRDLYRRAGHGTTAGSLNSAIHRLDLRVATVGLQLHRIYHRGLLLGPAGDAAPSVPTIPAPAVP